MLSSSYVETQPQSLTSPSSKTMKKLPLIPLCLAGLCAQVHAQYLELLNPLTGPAAVVTAGNSFKLNIAIAGAPVGSTAALDSYDIQLSGSTAALTALAPSTSNPNVSNGLNLTAFVNPFPSTFPGAQGTATVTEPLNNLFYGAAADSTLDDIPFPASTSPVTILTADFSTLSTLPAGTYTIAFYLPFTDLADGVTDPISFTPIDASIVVASATVPEPASSGMMFLGGAMIAALGLSKRYVLRK
jgi:PEP-CTERM motif